MQMRSIVLLNYEGQSLVATGLASRGSGVMRKVTFYLDMVQVPCDHGGDSRNHHLSLPLNLSITFHGAT